MDTAHAGWTMRVIREKPFEYYVDQASYFDYTHDDDDYDCGYSDEYLDLNPDVIKAVQKRGMQDRTENIPRRSVDQLAEFILKEGLLSKDDIDSVKYELHMDYSMEYGFI